MAGPDLSPDSLVYVEKVRQATRRLGATEVAPEDLRQAVQAVRNVSSFDVEVPTTSARREVQLVKVGVKRVALFYMRYLAGQLNAFGLAVVQMGETLASRTERLESGSDDVAARLGAVEARLRRLEATVGRTARDAGPSEPQSAGATPAAAKSAGTAPPAASAGKSPAPAAASAQRSRRATPRSRNGR